MHKVKFTKPAYLPVGAVISLNRAEYEHRREQVARVRDRKGWFRVTTPTGFTEGMEARLMHVPPELVAAGAVEEVRNIDA